MPIHWKPRFLWTLLVPILSIPRSLASETFEEELTIRALPDGKVASRFSFSTLLEGATPRNPQNLSAEDTSQHYTLFPLALGQILREYAVAEMHLTLNAGKWDYERWGYPDETDVGSGAELWAWMGDGAGATVDERWRGLRNALAGLFCASLGSLDELRTTSPAFSFAPHGGVPDAPLPLAIRHASMPSEHVCTENLTSFLKLLPCKSLSGIASLLNPHRLFDADWHGMGLHVAWLPDEGVQVRLTFQSVADPLRASLSKRDWSFASMFDRTIDRTCPSTASSRVIVALPLNEAYSIHPQPSSVEQGHAIFDLEGQNPPLDVSMQWAVDFDHAAVRPRSAEAPLSVRRTLQGSSQDLGRLSVFITNDGTADIQAAYLETMPWIVQFYLHTMTLRVDGVTRDDLIQNISYIPPIPHARAMTFQAVLALPARSTVHLSIDVRKAFLRYTEHPPDAQRGWDLPPAVLVPLGIGSGVERHGRRIYTPTLLVDLATPDFSMPYNVIIFSCTLVAYIFASVFNLLTRRFVVLHAELN
ncbi:Gpi16 subunit GPI transamidase component [Mycena maculata]|uniref:Gpi16 subunit GPI transamidase component n=1 Tax=Mycena maculata TaxID=230809 RepID=A0AAD7INH1_9AGAR|nr:Gpi16 subunit GPI transamidase component [Mycena maculata]